jgi:transposase InsO family protein
LKVLFAKMNISKEGTQDHINVRFGVAPHLDMLYKQAAKLRRIHKYLTSGFNTGSDQQKKAVRDASRSYCLVKNNVGNLVLQHKDKPGRIVPTTAKHVIQLVEQIHTKGGHKGRDSTQKAFALRYFFPGVNPYIAEHLRYCSGCTLKRVKRPANRLTLCVLKTSRPGQRIYMDYSKHKDLGYYLLCFIDHFSKYCWVKVYFRENSSNVLAGLESIWNMPGFIAPESLHYDNGSHFRNSGVAEFCEEKDVETAPGTAYWPEGQGVVERVHQTLKQRLFALCKDAWTYQTVRKLLKEVARDYNKESPHSTTGQTPERVYFRTETSNTPLAEKSSEEILHQAQRGHEKMLEIMNNRVNKQEEEVIEFEVGEPVGVINPSSIFCRDKRVKPKLLGYAEILEIHAPTRNSYRVQWLHNGPSRGVKKGGMPKRSFNWKYVTSVLCSHMCLCYLIDIYSQHES